MRYLLGTHKGSVTRIQEVLKAHNSVQFAKGVTREAVSDARKLKISKPVLSLNTEVCAAMIRASIAALTGAKRDAECVAQIVLGAPHTPAPVSRNTYDPTATWLDVVLGNVHRASSDQHRVMRDKAEQYSFEAVVRIGISGDHTSTRMNNIISALRTLESAGVHIRAEAEKPEHLNLATITQKQYLQKQELLLMLVFPQSRTNSRVLMRHNLIIIPAIFRAIQIGSLFRCFQMKALPEQALKTVMVLTR